MIELGISDANVVDISALAGPAGPNQIEFLWLGDNEITDISALLTYSNLSILNLRNDPLDFSSLCIYLKQIVVNNPGIDLRTTPAFVDIINRNATDVSDLDIFSGHWLDTTCSIADAYCHCADVDDDGDVQFDDFATFASWWVGL